MTTSEFNFIAESSNINKKSCSRTFDGTNITYFKFDHDCGNSLEGRLVGIPPAYDIAAHEGEFLSVKIVQPKDVLVYIKRIFGAWEEQNAQKSTIS
jgi:hypothetical protein